MIKIYILCIDDEIEVLEMVERDLAEFEDTFPIESAENANEARQRISAILDRGDHIGVIFCDHVMPGENGVELLVDLQKEEITAKSRKVLLTGQAGLNATVTAVNNADLNHYIAKPWDRETICQVARYQLTQYVLRTGLDPMPYIGLLNAEVLAEAIRKRGILADN